jgi:hypothetical protein
MRPIGKFSLMILLVSVLLNEQGADAANYYVATLGNDATGDGSIGNPWQTVPKGIRSLRAGDTLYIRGGTYTLNAVYGNSASDTYGCQSGCPTSWNTATKIMNYPGEKVTINHLGFNMDNNISTGGVAYLIWQGDSRANFIHQQNGSGGNQTGMRIYHSTHHIRLQTMTVRNFTSHGLGGGGPLGSCPSYIEIIDNEIRNNGDNSPDPGPYEHGMYPSCGDNWLISKNHVVGNWAFGIHVNNSVPDATKNFTIERNIVEGTGIPTGTRYGIVITTGYGHVVRNNLIIGQGSQPAKLTGGIAIAYSSTSALVANNTIHDVPIGLQSKSTTGTVTFKNNLMSGISNDNINIDSASRTSAEKNLCTTYDPDGGCSVITTTPGFLTPGSNFRLSSQSLAIDVGATISTVADDRDGISRPQGGAYDIGAYEGVSTAGVPPSPPKNLAVR